MNRQSFLDKVKEYLLINYTWPKQYPKKLEDYLKDIEEVMDGAKPHILISSPSLSFAWKQLGGKNRPTFKALRQIPLS